MFPGISEKGKKKSRYVRVGIRKNATKPKTCQFCGKEYMAYGTTQKFCGIACANDNQREVARKARESRPVLKTTRQVFGSQVFSIPCQECGNEMVKMYKGKKFFLCKACIQVWIREGKGPWKRNTGKRNFSKSERWRIMERDDFRCRYCGRRAPEVQLTVDHVIAWTRGGETSEVNGVTSCTECNEGKKAKRLRLVK